MNNKEYVIQVLEARKLQIEKQAENQRSMANSKLIHHKEPYELALAKLLLELQQCNNCIEILKQSI